MARRNKSFVFWADAIMQAARHPGLTLDAIDVHEIASAAVRARSDRESVNAIVHALTWRKEHEHVGEHIGVVQ
jgi:hypothetical protein